MQLILQISTQDFLELAELCDSVKKATNEKITVTNYIELMIQEELMMKNEIESNFKCCSLEKCEDNQWMINKNVRKNRKHSEALNFRVDKKTYLELTLIAKQRGISRADVCRERLKGLKYEPPLLAEDDRVALIKQLNQIGNNLNQAVKALNIIAKYFREQSENKKEKSLHFSFDVSRYNIFKDELANSIAKNDD